MLLRDFEVAVFVVVQDRVEVRAVEQGLAS